MASKRPPSCTPLSEDVWAHKGVWSEGVSLRDPSRPPAAIPREEPPQAEVSAMGLLTPETTLEEILALYQEVHWLRREPGEVQCTEDVVRKAHNKILEAIRACLWHVDGVPPSWQSLDKSPGHWGKHSITPTCSCLMTTSISTEPGSNHPEERP